jgi:hypothetical protein
MLQGVEFGATLNHTLVKGNFIKPVLTIGGNCVGNSHRDDFAYNYSYPKEHRLPKLDFPKFTGEHPKVWREKSEKYFSLYRIATHLWVTFATMIFKGNVEFWLQSYEASHIIDSWVELCVAVDQKFGKDIYN